MAGQEQARGSYEPTFIEGGMLERDIDMGKATAGAGVGIPHVEIPEGADEIGVMSEVGGMSDEDFHFGIASILRGQARSRSPYADLGTVNAQSSIPSASRKNGSADNRGIARI
ncbi:MAG: hypothetical protein ACHQT9_04375 [Candidatus Saccharimonadales bacterium]